MPFFSDYVSERQYNRILPNSEDEEEKGSVVTVISISDDDEDNDLKDKGKKTYGQRIKRVLSSGDEDSWLWYDIQPGGERHQSLSPLPAPPSPRMPPSFNPILDMLVREMENAQDYESDWLAENQLGNSGGDSVKVGGEANDLVSDALVALENKIDPPFSWQDSDDDEILCKAVALVEEREKNGGVNCKGGVVERRVDEPIQLAEDVDTWDYHEMHKQKKKEL